LKIAVSAVGQDLKSRVGDRLGTSPYLIIIDMETMAFEAIPNPGARGVHSVGMQTVAVAIDRKVTSVLTGYCSPIAWNYLAANRIEVLTGLEGTVEEVIRQYVETHDSHLRTRAKAWARDDEMSKDRFIHALRNSATQFFNIAPILVGIVLLIGLFQIFVSEELVSSIFTGHWASDILFGACLGSVVAGNPINSYIIGGELLGYGVGLFAVTAFIVAWVNVGLIQLPAESAALGWRFALARNSIAFIVSIIIALFTVSILFSFTG
jgi:predicted Fe-Mo cluster-binding NifX family protein